MITCSPAAIYRHRLLMMAKALRESPHPDRFTMSDVLRPCGSPGCAFGHYVFRTDLQDAYKPECDENGTWRPVTVDNVPVLFFGHEVAVHFGITPREHSELLDALGCGQAKTAKAAAKYVEEFVANKYPQWDTIGNGS